jgi:hypothetical protein
VAQRLSPRQDYGYVVLIVRTSYVLEHADHIFDAKVGCVGVAGAV